MNEVGRWVERKFAFDLPVDLYPNILTRLRGTPGRLEEGTRGLRREVLTAKPGGKWSVQENAGHLLDVEELWLARVEDFQAGAQVLKAADITNPQTEAARHNERELEEILQNFRGARGKMLERLYKLGREDFLHSARHPRLNVPMRLVDHLYFVAEHDDHHLARIWEMREGVLARTS